ncbi:MAG: FAD-dependent oxidoreductase [Kineosporiaceae bacterium]
MADSSAGGRPREVVRAHVAVVGGGRRAVRAARHLAEAGIGDVVLVTAEPLTAALASAPAPVSSVLAAAAATGHTWAFGYERARVAARDAAKPATLRGVDVVVAGTPRIAGARGRAALVHAPGDARCGETDVRARTVLVVPPLVESNPGVTGLPDEVSWRPDQVPSWTDLPFSLVVLGGGPTGCELAAAFAAWGSKVTVVEKADRLLPGVHPSASTAVQRRLEAAGVRVLLGGTVTRVAPTLDDGVYVGTDVGGDVAATHLVLATGAVPEAVPGAAALEAQLRVPRRLWRPATWRRPELLSPPDEVAPVVLATSPQVAHVGMPQAPDGGVVAATEVPVPGVEDGRLVLVHTGGRLRGACAVGDGAGLAVAEAALALSVGVPLAAWARVGRCGGLASSFEGHSGGGDVGVLAAAWGQAYARALELALE